MTRTGDDDDNNANDNYNAMNDKEFLACHAHRLPLLAVIATFPVPFCKKLYKKIFISRYD